MTNTLRRLSSRAHSGFTLLEVMVVLVLIAMLAAAGIPSVTRAIAHNRINNSAAVIAGDFQLAFSLAARERRPLVITVNAAGASYRIADRAGTVIRERNLGDHSDLHVGSMSSSTSTLNIYPNGLSSGPISVRVTIGDYTQRITMTRAGQVRITS
jgi:type II secretion system protein H